MAGGAKRQEQDHALNNRARVAGKVQNAIHGGEPRRP